MKRAPATAPTLAELPAGDRPPRLAPPLPDIHPPERPWHGSVAGELRRRDEENGQLRARIAELEFERRELLGAITDAANGMQRLLVALHGGARR